LPLARSRKRTGCRGMESLDIDSDSLQAVKNLRSKFEKLALETSSQQQTDLLIVTAPSSPRPRAASNTQLTLPLSNGSGGQLRSSSSSSDLRLLARRAPPPPPPRASKLLNNPSPSRSPSSSPLLRSVPVPYSLISPNPREQPPPRNPASPVRSPSPFLLSRPVPIPPSSSSKAELKDQSLGIVSTSVQRP
jgi:hypothetical protein